MVCAQPIAGFGTCPSWSFGIPNVPNLAGIEVTAQAVIGTQGLNGVFTGALDGVLGIRGPDMEVVSVTSPNYASGTTGPRTVVIRNNGNAPANTPGSSAQFTVTGFVANSGGFPGAQFLKASIDTCPTGSGGSCPSNDFDSRTITVL